MKIAVSGAAGRMGKRILALTAEQAECGISGALEGPECPFLGRDAGEIAGIGHIGVPISSDRNQVIANCDVLIDFSSPTASIANLEIAANLGKAIVIGSTGFSEEQKPLLAEFGARTRCLAAPNMSMGVNLLFKVVKSVSQALGPDYDVEIVEAHHNMKQDAPSGTADKLARIIASELGRDLDEVGVYGRKGIVGRRTQKEIGVMALRGGDIVGDHTVMFVTGGERIELIHRAHSRDAFARGAVRAALWLKGQPNGIYDMQDVLGLK